MFLRQNVNDLKHMQNSFLLDVPHKMGSNLESRKPVIFYFCALFSKGATQANWNQNYPDLVYGSEYQ